MFKVNQNPSSKYAFNILVPMHNISSKPYWILDSRDPTTFSHSS